MKQAAAKYRTPWLAGMPTNLDSYPVSMERERTSIHVSHQSWPRGWSSAPDPISSRIRSRNVLESDFMRRRKLFHGPSGFRVFLSPSDRYPKFLRNTLSIPAVCRSHSIVVRRESPSPTVVTFIKPVGHKSLRRRMSCCLPAGVSFNFVIESALDE